MNNLIIRIPPKFNFFEVYEQDENESTRRVQLVVLRNNSYPIQEQHRLVFELLERAGVRVIVRVAGNDLTLEQFEQYGQFAPGTGRISKTVINKQGFYNIKSQLNLLKKEIAQLPDDSPQHDILVRKISHLTSMLSSAEPELVVTPESLSESSKALDKLIQVFENLEKGDNTNVTSQ